MLNYSLIAYPYSYPAAVDQCVRRPAWVSPMRRTCTTALRCVMPPGTAWCRGGGGGGGCQGWKWLVMVAVVGRECYGYTEVIPIITGDIVVIL